MKVIPTFRHVLIGCFDVLDMVRCASPGFVDQFHPLGGISLNVVEL